MKQRFSGSETAKTSSEIAALFDLSVGELKDLWRSIYGSEPPPRSCRKLLVSGIAYRMQERVFGGLKRSVRRLLERAPRIQVATGFRVPGPTQKPLPAPF